MQIFPWLKDDIIAASEAFGTGSEAIAATMGCREHSFCFLVSNDLTFIKPFKAGYPVHQLWNGYSPFEAIEPVKITQLSEIESIKTQ